MFDQLYRHKRFTLADARIYTMQAAPSPRAPQPALVQMKLARKVAPVWTMAR